MVIWTALIWKGHPDIGEGDKTDEICLSLAETAKSNGIDFYKYVKKLLTELLTLENSQQPEILD